MSSFPRPARRRSETVDARSPAVTGQKGPEKPFTGTIVPLHVERPTPRGPDAHCEALDPAGRDQPEAIQGRGHEKVVVCGIAELGL